MSDDIDNMHYAVSKALQEVKAHKAHIKELDALVRDMQAFVDNEVAGLFAIALKDIHSRYKKEETSPCSS